MDMASFFVGIVPWGLLGALLMAAVSHRECAASTRRAVRSEQWRRENAEQQSALLSSDNRALKRQLEGAHSLVKALRQRVAILESEARSAAKEEERLVALVQDMTRELARLQEAQDAAQSRKTLPVAEGPSGEPVSGAGGILTEGGRV